MYWLEKKIDHDVLTRKKNIDHDLVTRKK
jgi:hypothetical protein